MTRYLAAAAFGAFALAACNRPDASTVTNDEVAIENGAVAEGNLAAAGTPDATYVQNAAASDMFEIESSKLALEKATLPALKTYAEMMIAEHGTSSAELKIAAASAGIPVPTMLPPPLQAKLEALRTKSGAGFDQQYLADQRAGHQDTLTKVNAYLAGAPAGPLKDHASKVTGVVQKHLNAVEKIK